MIDTRTLGQAIERAEVGGLRACVASAQRIAPQLEAQALEVLDGIAPFCGAGSPLSEATGVGISQEPTAADVERITRFYVERGTPPRINVSALASLELTRLLARAGYRPVEHANVLACEIATSDCARDFRIVECDDAQAWGRASTAGFIGREPSGEEAIVGIVIAAIPEVTALAAYDDGAIVATGAMDVDGELAGLFAASTLVTARGRGWQRAFIADRLARARESGARYARTAAGVGTASERNFRRAGFEVLYTRTVWERSL